ncbi:Fe3+-hydroxamate ABC transporter periplasmic protein [Natrinema pellirubrum DSM 15624]|uniref:ABC-type Fe3+-hydroxamate transport system, periplasmic component n=1 Tax=Natrinema pellirubrum (strain DSM 15624 / CIP 106293 / JCM 10476 / NCIMB 786 / 157) TaxID=797303 RepID=L0JSS2_NATP1|nr:ABC transporter substrate-binding protein [Natrinema pellirubrum]AGB33426.1 ABC-type Fe3+-hydroxamate transport system, periplasmic component [Natrinema pellirubrum DSM 15624]ELY71254.1 Fe3+-hydroxamate ABC transporter periplasmic protein [Natrinema pellirubrum DSM 15624]
MSNEPTWTRRNVLRTSGTIAGVSALAGCISGDGPDDEGDVDPYTVSMPPVGDVEFESVPETWAAGTADWADMGIALGQEPPVGLYIAGRLHSGYYDDIPDVSVGPDDIDTLWDDEFGPEKFIGLAEDVDALVMDPNFLTGRADWSGDAIERIESTGTPFFGNSITSRGYSWHEDYDYLTMYEAFEKLAEVFQEQERYDEFETLHDEFQSELENVVPSSDRPEVAVLYPQIADDSFLPYTIDESTSYKHLRDLGVEDALANSDVQNFHNTRGSIDYETLLEVNPEYILLRTEQYLSEEEFQQNYIEPIQSHDAGQKLTAVQNDNVYKTVPFYQGPIINLVAAQRLAEQLYDVDEQLYDPQEVSDIVNGDF